jgi:hypothetical protein
MNYLLVEKQKVSYRCKTPSKGFEFFHKNYVVIGNSDVAATAVAMATVSFQNAGYCGQPRTQVFLLPRLDGQRKRPWLRLVCFAT